MNETTLEGFYSFQEDATDQAAPLADKECVAVKLSVWSENKDGSAITDQAAETVYWGFGGNCVHPLRAGDTTELIFVTNLKQIFVRRTKRKTDGNTKIYFSCFREVN